MAMDDRFEPGNIDAFYLMSPILTALRILVRQRMAEVPFLKIWMPLNDDDAPRHVAPRLVAEQTGDRVLRMFYGITVRWKEQIDLTVL